MELTGRFRDAVSLALELHRGHTRKGKAVPYMAHLLSVCALVLEHLGDEDTAIAALLHDAAEDCGGEATLARIEAGFGSRVAGLVRECSDSLGSPRPPWRRRKEAYLAGIPRMSREARLVSLCDKVHNARCLVWDLQVARGAGDEVFGRFSGGAEGVRWYYSELLRVYTGLGDPRLSGLVRELERLVGIIGGQAG